MSEAEIWAAIDLQRGRVVSLRKGDPDQSMVWGNSPQSVVDRWEREGANGLHIVDLDGALETGSNRTAIESIVHHAKIPVQVGGGIRSEADVQRWLELGVARVVLGTLAYNDPPTLSKILKRYGSERIVVAVDYRSRMIVTKGWTKDEALGVPEAVDRLQAAGIRTVLATAVEFDGTATGPDVATLRSLRAATSMRILASGGVRTIDDVRELKRIGVDGVVIGRALYEGTISLPKLKLEEQK